MCSQALLEGGAEETKEVLDGISGPSNIANVFATNLRSLLNTHSPSVRNSLQHSIQSSLSTTQLQDIVVTEDDVVQAIHLLKKGKSDSQNLFSEHLKYACAVIAVYLAYFFTACFRHGFILHSISDCVLIPIPKDSKDASHSQNYRPIALAL